MGRIHALEATGEVVKDVEVFRRAYQLIGLGWLYVPTGWPLLAPLVNALYAVWASARLRITGRQSLEQLCAIRGGRCGGFPSADDRVAVRVVPPAGSADLERSEDAVSAGGL
jgi:hypothetical protein